MDRISPPVPVHLVPPLPQRISTRSQRNGGAVQVTPPSPLSTSARNQQHIAMSLSVCTSGRFKRSGISSNSSHRLSNLHRVAPRAVNNDYRDLLAPGGDNRHYTASRDVIVELSGSGETVSRTTSVQRPVIDVNQLTKFDNAAMDDRFSKQADIDNVRTVPTPCVESILCPDCGKCRCAECARRSPVLCCDSSASCCAGCDRAVDAVTCMCCVRALFSSDSDDNPCICPKSPGACCLRWTILVGLSACLPCLCLYLPLRCLVCTCSELCTSSRGSCRCQTVPAVLPPAVDSWQTSPKHHLETSDVTKTTYVMTSTRVIERN